jgi:glyoxylase-like metal-dependent hydrolase (beta-lactamase superfamily II)
MLIKHGHSDHIAEADELSRLSGARVYAGKEEKVPGAVALNIEDRLALGELTIHVHHTPGHSPGHVC